MATDTIDQTTPRVKLQIFDGRGCATGEIVDAFHCAECGSVVVDMPRHIAWHKALDRQITDARFSQGVR